MTDTNVTIRTGDEILLESNLQHWLCCRTDRDITICGAPAPEGPYEIDDSKDYHVECVVCDDIHQRTPYHFCSISNKPCKEVLSGH